MYPTPKGCFDDQVQWREGAFGKQFKFEWKRAKAETESRQVWDQKQKPWEEVESINKVEVSIEG